ncbi:MAG: SBBP repeat-containing protein [Anaerolineae bacterium]|nr:SBBP repeat-containing protein [Anaerolineae bacterium]
MTPLTLFLSPLRWLPIIAIVIVYMLLPAAVAADDPPSAPIRSQPVTLTGLTQLPLSFLPLPYTHPSQGQFESRTPQGTLRFEPDGVTLREPNMGKSVTSWRFLNTEPDVQIKGSMPLPGVVNRYEGLDINTWQTGLTTYGQVSYHGLYPGIDLMYDGQQGLLKGTFTVAPGSDPGRIRWHYPQAQQIAIDASSGDMEITFANQATLTEQAPIAWQTIAGQQNPVAVQFQADDDTNIAGFALGDYDPAYPLIIDPTLIYSTTFGGNSDDIAVDIATDNAGNIYLTGHTYSTSFPGGGSGNAGYNDLFITKINAAGTAILYTTILGGNGTDEAGGIAVTDSGSQVWVMGQTTSSNFPTKQAFQAQYGGSVDAMIVRLNSSGGLTFSSYIGGDRFDAGQDLVLDSQGDVHFTGSIAGGFFGKIDGQSGALLYNRMITGQAATGYGIAIDGQDYLYITGEIRSDSWPTVNPVQATCGRFDNWTCSTDAFVVKLNQAGDDLLFSTYLGGSAQNGGSGTDIGRKIGVDSSGNIALTGETFASDFPLANAAQAQKRGANNFSEGFVTRIVRQGAQYKLGFSTYLGGQYSEYAGGLAVTRSGQVFVSGVTNSEDFPVAAPMQGSIGPGVCITAGGVDRYCNDAYITQFSTAGQQVFSTYWGGTRDDSAGGMVIDPNGNLYVVGRSESSNFPTSVTSTGLKQTTSENIFLVKMTTGVSSPPPGGTFRVYVPMVVQGR